MAKRKIIWSPKAKFDLYSILEFYYIRNGSKAYSNKLNTSLRSAIRLLEVHPDLGIKTDVKDMRNLIHGDLLIFYEIKESTIEIITIWDSRRDPELIINN